jgi:hypothetical protein
MSEWTIGKPLIATEEHVSLPWSGSSDNFRCGFCGHRIIVGERWCFVFTNDLVGAGGNPLACGTCIDHATTIAEFAGEALREILRDKWVHQCEEWRTFMQSEKWWKFQKGVKHVR